MKKIWFIHLLGIFAGMLLGPSWGLCAAPAPTELTPFFETHCFACHGHKKASGDLNLEGLRLPQSVADEPERWEEIRNRILNGDMPPAKRPRPPAVEVKAAAAWIDGALDRADLRALPEPGRVMARRLNRAEYNNTVRDLLGIDLDLARDFPQDDAAYGFDNIAEALTTSPLLVEKYLVAAEVLGRLAVFGPEMKKPSTVRFTPAVPRRLEDSNPVRLEEPAYYSKQSYDRTGFSHPGSFHETHIFPATGTYLFRFVPAGARPLGSDPQRMTFWLDGKEVHSFVVREPRTVTNESVPMPHEVRLKVTAGPHEIVAGFPQLFEGLGPQKSSPFAGLALALVEVVGPYGAVRRPSSSSQKKIFVCRPARGDRRDVCVRRIIANLARRAFRGPTATTEIDELVALFSNAKARGRSFEEALALVVQAVLVAPEFLFRIETNPPSTDDTARVSPFELATRLSYFLWSSMPDEELAQAASLGSLRNSELLDRQVRRMLADPRAEALVINFAGQWLEGRRLEAMQPDRDRFPDFDDYLRQSMQRETTTFVRDVLLHDRSVVDFLTADYSFVNERLGAHYGMKGVVGPAFRRVSLAGTGRAGVLHHASVLTVSSYNNRTSPVLRGKWILENILNAPPPPPPPNVPALDESVVGTTMSLRKQMEQHRANPVCASCHQRMDALGFALENYNAVGAWRTMDGKLPIDPRGALPNGRPIEGPGDLTAILSSDSEAFVRGLTEKMLTYALGRGVERFDRAQIKKITADVAASGYHSSRLILGIVHSVPFQMRTKEPPRP